MSQFELFTQRACAWPRCLWGRQTCPACSARARRTLQSGSRPIEGPDTPRKRAENETFRTFLL